MFTVKQTMSDNQHINGLANQLNYSFKHTDFEAIVKMYCCFSCKNKCHNDCEFRKKIFCGLERILD